MLMGLTLMGSTQFSRVANRQILPLSVVFHKYRISRKHFGEKICLYS